MISFFLEAGTQKADAAKSESRSTEIAALVPSRNRQGKQGQRYQTSPQWCITHGLLRSDRKYGRPRCSFQFELRAPHPPNRRGFSWVNRKVRVRTICRVPNTTPRIEDQTRYLTQQPRLAAHDGHTLGTAPQDSATAAKYCQHCTG